MLVDESLQPSSVQAGANQAARAEQPSKVRLHIQSGLLVGAAANRLAAAVGNVAEMFIGISRQSKFLGGATAVVIDKTINYQAWEK